LGYHSQLERVRFNKPPTVDVMCPDSSLPSPEDPSDSEDTSGHSATISEDGAPPKMDVDAKTIIGSDAPTSTDSAAATHQVGESIGKYEIRARLGTGGMGAVYLAFDTLIEREVAIKVLSHDVAASKVALQRFLQEARSIGRLNHPNVVSIYDIDLWNGQYYIVMELIGGGSLADLVDQRGALPWQEACRLIAQAALGLSAAHAAGMVHRDIKPENLMQTKDGVVKVVDFGLSKLVDAADDTRQAVTKQGQILGTPQYMSPEQFESTEVDLRTDIYSLGASLYRLLTGRFPFQDCSSIVQTMMAHLTKPVPKAKDFSSEIPAECDQVIMRAMAKSPSDRFQHVHQMADELIALIQSHGGVWAGAGTVTSREHPFSRTETIVADRIVEYVVPLRSAVIVEPSKMLAAMMKDAVVRAGATRVDVVSSKEQAINAIASQVPNLLVTAMQLPDGLAIEMIGDICRKLPLGRTCIVLNSSDSTMEELVGSGSVASHVLAPKRARPEDVLRIVHAGGPIEICQGPIVAPLDLMNVRLVILTDLEKAPDALAELIREVGLMDVSVLGLNDVASIPGDEVSTVVLKLRKVEGPASPEPIPEPLPNPLHLLADVDFDGASLTLRSLLRQEVRAAIRRNLDVDRLKCLLQACRVS
jgi:serine/threonine protein kinase